MTRERLLPLILLFVLVIGAIMSLLWWSVLLYLLVLAAKSLFHAFLTLK